MAVLGGVGLVLALSAAEPAYACAQQWTAPATQSPATQSPTTQSPNPSGSPAPRRIGYVQQDLGRGHIAVGQSVAYPLCPPASGRHYNASNLGPIKAQVYGPDEPTVPQGWIHNLEHGGLVVLYKCPGPGCDDAGQAAFRQFYSTFPPSPICKIPVGSVGPVITRFDEMAYPIVAMLWGQVLPLDTWDPNLVLAFFNQQAERTNPEQACALPTATPGPSTPAPSASPSAGTSPSTPASPVGSASPPASAPAASGSPVAGASPTAAPN